MSEFEDFINTLASLGEQEVREKLSQGVWANRRKSWAEDWIRDLDVSRVNTRAEVELALSREANEIAKSSLTVARSAKNISLAAIVISIFVAITVALLQAFGQK